jgi:hypothetical protein
MNSKKVKNISVSLHLRNNYFLVTLLKFSYLCLEQNVAMFAKLAVRA